MTCRLTDEQRRAILKKARAIRAPQSLSVYLDYIFPNYRQMWFHRLIASKCQALLDGTLGRDRLMVFIPPQHGKALFVETPVLTCNRGWVLHGDLRPGDHVFSPAGAPVMVEAVTPHYEWECRKVVFEGGEEIIASYNHEWGCYIPDSSHKAIYYPDIETDMILRKRYDRNPYLLCSKPLQFPDQALPVPPYILGLWLGDGSVGNKQICKTVDDANFFLSQCAGHIVREKKGVVYFILDELNNTLLRSVGALDDKHIPNMYMFSSYRQRLELLQGLMDADGSCDRRGNCEIVQTREKLSFDIFELITSLGYKPRMVKGKAKIYGREVSDKYRVLFNPDRDDDVFRLPRKLSRLRNKKNADRGDKYKHFIRSIDPCGICVVNCIQVEGGYYLAGKELRPTHNSEIASRAFPAWALGRNPDLKIVGTSHTSSLAESFSRSVQLQIDSEEYQRIFPGTFLNGSFGHPADNRGFQRTVETFETVGRRGFYKAVGVGGSLTGTPADIAIIDDPVKDAEQAFSATVREKIWEWYNSVLLTRLHNRSKQLFIMTRWHEDDLAGRILRHEADKWAIINIPALCVEESDGGLGSGRHVGDALWEEEHSRETLVEAQRRNPAVFNSLYQQDPQPIEGLMYSRFRTYDTLPVGKRTVKNYTDTADTGADWLCSIDYAEYHATGECYVLDVLFTDKPMEYTEPETARMATKDSVAVMNIESNNGGRGFARNVERNLRAMGNTATQVRWFTQTRNKDARIFTRSADAQNLVFFPSGWERMWPQFHSALASYRKEGRNAHDDAPDALTGIVENCAAVRGQSDLERLARMIHR